MSIYGVPYVIHTDQGTNIESNLFKEICNLLGIAKTRTSPYHPKCDGQVEQMNRTIIEQVKLNVKNPTKNWDLEIGLSLMAYRSAVQSSIGFTSYYLLYEKKMRLPLDIIYRPPLTENSRADFANDVRCKLEQAYETVRENFILHMNGKKIITIGAVMVHVTSLATAHNCITQHLKKE